MRRFTWFNATSIALGFAFLYIPILLLVIYSFNESKLVTVWGGWSTKWYASLLENEGILNAAWVTLRVAIVSSTLATVLGTLAAIVLVRMGRFPGRTLFSGMIFAPLVMPEVITGLSLLLLFVAINLDRGFWTVVIAHATFSMCFAAVVVQVAGHPHFALGGEGDHLLHAQGRELVFFLGASERFNDLIGGQGHKRQFHAPVRFRQIWAYVAGTLRVPQRKRLRHSESACYLHQCR